MHVVFCVDVNENTYTNISLPSFKSGCFRFCPKTYIHTHIPYIPTYTLCAYTWQCHHYAHKVPYV